MTSLGENASRARFDVEGTSGKTVELSWFAMTDVGKRRETNQDSLVAVPPIFSVADGMGGHSLGEVASGAVVRSLSNTAQTGSASRENIIEALSEAVDAIELDAGETDLGAGTTVTGVYLTQAEGEPIWECFNIGDSRVYQWFRGALTQITVDHSVVQHLIDTGQISEDDAEFHPHANVITRAVGFNEEPVPDFTQLALVPGQRILICSDGLTKEITHQGIAHFLAQSDSAEGAAQTLVDQAVSNAGRDNVAVIVIDVHAVGDDKDTSELQSLPNTAEK
jgi:serine/threonine protein phosphatase PrpC